jgi:16S rRNA G1207 methylase RsmC
MEPLDSSVASPARLPARLEEQRLLDVALNLPGERIGVYSPGRAQAAEELARQRPHGSAFAWYLDGYQASLARRHAAQLPNLSIRCQADWPEEAVELALVAASKGAESELTRDVVQSAYHQLVLGGQLAVSVDNPEDHWVHELLKGYSKHVRVRPSADAVVYILEKSAPLKKLKDYRCELSFRDCDATIRTVTRPGVFSHRRLDNGARQILDAVDVFPEARLLDIGSGSGAIALGLAMRDPSAVVEALDSNARAVDCTRCGVALNGLENVVVSQHWEGDYGEPQRFDMALANPPYYADMRIAEWFMQLAHHALRVGGRLVLVTKQPAWYEANMPKLFQEVETYESGRYHIASGVKA